MVDGKNRTHDPLEGITADGMIVTGAHSSRIVADFRPVLDEAVKQLSSSNDDFSLYAYGSVVTGTARVGYSDVDLVTLGVDPESARKLGERLSEKFSKLCRSVEVGAGQHSGYSGTSDESYGNKVFLRHYCVHLAGSNFQQRLPDFPADKAAARGFNGDIRLAVDKWKAEVAHDTDYTRLGRRIARKMLFAISSLVSIHDHTWTTDRLAAAKRWGEVMPEIRGELDALVFWGEAPSTTLSRADVLSMLGGFTDKVVDAFNEQIGLWKP